MALFSIPGVSVSGIAAAVPADIERNEDFDLLTESERKDFINKVGIGTRRVAPPGLCASDLCLAASKQLMEAAKITPASIGILVFVTQTPDYVLPGNSMKAQVHLGLSTSTILLDLNQGCAGYVYGLSTIAALMNASEIEYGLLLVGDTITRMLSRQDRTTFPIFSDAGSATLLQRKKTATPIYFNLGADGKGLNSIYINDGGCRNPFQSTSLDLKEEFPGVRRAGIHLRMEGVDVLNYSLKNVIPNVITLLNYSGHEVSQIDHFVFHQANRILNQSLVKKMGIPEEKVPETLSLFGNTSSATIPLTILYRLSSVLAYEKKKLLLSGFGVGFSWGSALIDMEKIICPPLIELTSQDA
ncbi:MAG: 3-oxoacyl-ACP synthase III family protein [Flavitalea sp.]